MSDLSGSFTKYQGNGNDFVIFETNQPKDLKSLSPMAQKVCDRHRGVGADGLILLSFTDQWHMDLFNQDGSIAQNCGNGLRCVADYIFKKTGMNEVLINFYGRDYRCQKNGEQITVDMGQAAVEIKAPVIINGFKAEVAQVFIGNHHVVLYFDGPIEPESLLIPAKEIFKENVNLGFIYLQSGRYLSTVHESGVGFTKSCGTGACAQAAFLAVLNQEKYNKAILIEQPGGAIEVSSVRLEPIGDVHMFHIAQAGGAQAVFSGYWPKNDELIGQ